MKICVIGAGPGGYEAALYAAKRGAEVVLVEKDRVGGTCLNRGCIPTKAFLASYEVLETVRKADDFGIGGLGEPTVDYPAIAARKNKVMETLVRGIEFLCTKTGVKTVYGTAQLRDGHSVHVSKSDGTDELIEADYIILATGSVPVKPAVFGVDGRRVITSDEALSFAELPKSLIIVGGGVIGCEIGQFFSAMGTDVTIVEALPRLVSVLDEDASKLLARQFKKEKIKVVTGDAVAETVSGENGAVLRLSSGKELSAQYVLVAVGRAPNTAGLGLAAAGVETDSRGAVLVDACMKTNVDSIYAIGDIVPTPQFAHVSGREGCVAVDNIFGADKRMRYNAVPSCIFTNPELASCGILEKDLQAQGKQPGVDYRVGSFDFKGLGKAQATGRIFGFVKVVCDMNDVIIGAEIAGDRAADMLQVLTTAIACGLTAEQVGESIFPHPTMCEAVKEALHDIHGMSVHKI
ncbi:MAG: dihydrolipoyl dehydrogenase [Ruminococcaceae bacterium]|nr:dihydrolipoyl dehydrogenase [Oscillospiraceae bacterium]